MTNMRDQYDYRLCALSVWVYPYGQACLQDNGACLEFRAWVGVYYAKVQGRNLQSDAYHETLYG